MLLDLTKHKWYIKFAICWERCYLNFPSYKLAEWCNFRLIIFCYKDKSRTRSRFCRLVICSGIEVRFVQMFFSNVSAVFFDPLLHGETHMQKKFFIDLLFHYVHLILNHILKSMGINNGAYAYLKLISYCKRPLWCLYKLYVKTRTYNFKDSKASQ